MRRHATVLAAFALAFITAARARGADKLVGKPDDLIDRRYLNDFAKSGFFDRLWEGKR